MIDPKAQAALARLERQDADERERGLSSQERLRQVTPEVGRFLHTMVRAVKPRNIIEIGTSGGYSTVWLATAARGVGGHIVTLEMDPAKVRAASASLRDAGVADVVTQVEGDAFSYLRERREPADFVFLDAEKEDYVAYLELIVPLLSEGGVLVADNLLSHADDLAEFHRRAHADPRLSTVDVPIERGELLAVKVG